MSIFIYAGVQFDERTTRILDFRREPVMNGPDYLFTRYLVHVAGQFNPAATGFPGGSSPAATDGAVRHKLAQARQPLTLKVGTTTLLSSPSLGSVDAQNGPISRVLDVRRVDGTQNFEVEMMVETFVNETAKASALQSNRWSMTHDLDADFFCTRVVRGHAVFRSDRLAKLQAFPDDYRAYLVPPIPQNFKRDHIEVVADEDGCEVDYLVVDKQMPTNIIVPGVTRIECMHRRSMFNEGIEQAATAVQMEYTRTLWNELSINPTTWLSAPLSATAKAAVRAAGSLPRMAIDIGVRVWGDPSTSNSTLQGTAVAFVADRVSDINVNYATTHTDIGRDEMGRFVEMHMRIELGPIYTAIVLPRGQTIPSFSFPAGDIAGITQTGGGVNSTPPGDQLSRGTYAARCVAAALLPADTVPPPVTEPAASRKLSP